MRALPVLIAGLLLAGCRDSTCCSMCMSARQDRTTTRPPKVALDIGRDGRSWGTIIFELDPIRAPITTRNFLRYVDEGYYDGTIIHRVLVGEGARIQIFQGGGYTAPGQPPKPGQHEPIKLETNVGLSNVRGTIAMARDADPDTATSEFFVNLADNTRLDYTDPEKPGYAVFGHIVEGWDTVARIMTVETETNPDPVLKGEKSQPLNPPVLLRARRVQCLAQCFCRRNAD